MGRLSPLRWVAAFLAGCLAGCGGAEEELPPATTITLLATLDGFLVNDGTVATAGTITVGDQADNLSTRGFVRFPLAAVPAGSLIESAILTMRQVDVVSNPYGGLGTAIRLDRMALGTGLDSSDFYAIPLNPGVATLSVGAGLGTKNADVTASVQADVSGGRLTSDFRLRFPTETDFDSQADFTRWESSEDAGATGSVPVLVVTYR